MKNTFLFLFTIFSFAATYGQWEQLGNDVEGDINRRYGRTLDLNGDGTIMAVGSSIVNEVSIYEYDGTDWQQLGNTIDSGGLNLGLGFSISLNEIGDIIGIGVLDENSLRVYEYDGTSWNQLGGNITGIAISEFGHSVALNASGNRIVGSSTGYDSPPIFETGLVEVYEFNGSDWIQLGQSIIGENQDQLGFRVAINDSGSSIAVQSIGYQSPNGENIGLTRIYELQSNSWIQKGQDLLGDSAPNGNKGVGLAMNSEGNIVAVGSPGYNWNLLNDGIVETFEYIGDSWTQIGQTLIGPEEYDNFGSAVDFSDNGEFMVVGARQVVPGTGNISGKGYANVYRFFNNNWVQVGDSIIGEDIDDISGNTVSMSNNGSIIAIGSPNNDDGGFNGGQIRVYGNDNVLGYTAIPNNEISIYPIPVNNQITIDLGYVVLDLDISLYDVQGRMLKSDNFDNTQSVKWDVSLDSGVYLLKLQFGNSEVVKRILVH